ncbi:sialidase family protein [Larkinella rosea]|uniref:Exo-alpha-sialidase n=1 Tax=Larkinella rosea TaxID=2025312 RepID=A0A3P1BA89_9BACT|nr:sialidase family protein [Larkinella rosea]RRA98017.1 exo-alpha-sialidase [Larkinella rosea]
MTKSYLLFLGLILSGFATAQKTAIPATDWAERSNEPLSVITNGIPAFDKTVIQYKQNGRLKYRVTLGEPVVVSVADKEEKWGHFQFPDIARTIDGTIAVKWNMANDNMEAYGGTSSPTAISADGGKTWKPGPTDWEHTILAEGVLMPNGERIKIVTPKPVKESELTMPSPVGSMTRRNYKHTFYKLTEMPASRQGVFLARRKEGERAWQNEQATLDDPQALRYSLRGMVPVVWWGDLKVAADRSVVACVYPGFHIRDDGSVDTKGGVFFYRSTDSGHSWKILSRIPYQPDTKIDTNGVNKFWFTEPAFEILSNGTYLSVIRSHDIYSGPLYASRSTDQGKTFTKPEVFAPNGVFPRLLQLKNGVTVVASGRPGVQIRFSNDGKGEQWTNAFEMLPFGKNSTYDQVSCGYTGLLPTGDNSFLIVYSDFDFKNPQGQIRKAIKVREVTVSPR